MAVYTIISVVEAETAPRTRRTTGATALHEAKVPPRPCWILDAVSSQAALAEAWKLREAGRMPWLPPLAALAVRRASKIERQKFAELMLVKPVGGEITGNEDATRRAERMANAFFLKLWRGTI